MKAAAPLMFILLVFAVLASRWIALNSWAPAYSGIGFLCGVFAP